MVSFPVNIPAIPFILLLVTAIPQTVPVCAMVFMIIISSFLFMDKTAERKILSNRSLSESCTVSIRAYRYSPSADCTFEIRSSFMSRDMVACVARTPRVMRYSESSSWVRISNSSIRSRMILWRVYFFIFRSFILIFLFLQWKEKGKSPDYFCTEHNNFLRIAYRYRLSDCLPAHRRG